jgi:hypothetical protein
VCGGRTAFCSSRWEDCWSCYSTLSHFADAAGDLILQAPLRPTPADAAKRCASSFAERNLTVACLEDAANTSSFCAHTSLVAHSRGTLSFLHLNYLLTPSVTSPRDSSVAVAGPAMEATCGRTGEPRRRPRAPTTEGSRASLGPLRRSRASMA